MTGDNGPQLEGFQLPPRHCGEWVAGPACRICGEWLEPLPEHLILSDN